MSKWIDQNFGDSSSKSGGQSSQGFMQTASTDISNILSSLGIGIVPHMLASEQQVAQNLSGQTPNSAESPYAYQNMQNPIQQIGKDVAGGASWAVPQTDIFKAGEGANILTKVLGLGANQAIQGGLQGGLGAVSQGQNPVQGVGIGAVTNPVLSGVGNILTDTLPRYIGLRNYGAAGLKLPEVVQAENAATKGGMDSLEAARQDLISKIPKFDTPMENNANASQKVSPNNLAQLLLGEAKKTSDYAVSPVDRSFGNVSNTTAQVISPQRQALMDKINTLAKSPGYVGAPGVSDLVKKSTKALPQQAGELPTIQSAIVNSSDAFDAYNRIKNMADWTRNTLGDKAESFIKQASHIAREHLIETSDNPAATRKAMDNYAAQVAMKAGKGIGGNSSIGQAALGGLGEGGLAALATLLPALSGVSLPLALDTALTNKLTGPSLARGLVNVGQKANTSGISSLLTRLGISGMQGLTQGLTQ